MPYVRALCYWNGPSKHSSCRLLQLIIRWMIRTILVFPVARWRSSVFQSVMPQCTKVNRLASAPVFHLIDLLACSGCRAVTSASFDESRMLKDAPPRKAIQSIAKLRLCWPAKKVVVWVWSREILAHSAKSITAWAGHGVRDSSLFLNWLVFRRTTARFFKDVHSWREERFFDAKIEMSDVCLSHACKAQGLSTDNWVINLYLVQSYVRSIRASQENTVIFQSMYGQTFEVPLNSVSHYLWVNGAYWSKNYA